MLPKSCAPVSASIVPALPGSFRSMKAPVSSIAAISPWATTRACHILHGHAGSKQVSCMVQQRGISVFFPIKAFHSRYLNLLWHAGHAMRMAAISVCVGRGNVSRRSGRKPSLPGSWNYITKNKRRYPKKDAFFQGVRVFLTCEKIYFNDCICPCSGMRDSRRECPGT